MTEVVLTAKLAGVPTDDVFFDLSIDGAPRTRQTTLPGHVTVSIADSVSVLDVFVVPAGAATGAYWELHARFTRGADNTFTRTSGPLEFQPAEHTGISCAITVHLTRLSDVTTVALAALAPVPLIRRTSDDRFDVPSEWPPGSGVAWPPGDLAPQQLGAYSYLADPPVVGGQIKTTTATLEPVADTRILQIKGKNAPATVAVSWPSALPRDDSDTTPFLVFFHPTANQNVPTYYENPALGSLPQYPLGFDYVLYMHWRYLNYTGDPLSSHPTPGNPNASRGPTALGLPYQMCRSGKAAVLVVPSNNAAGEVSDLLDLAYVRSLLTEITAFMLRRADPPAYESSSSVGRTALAGFSNGNDMPVALLGLAKNKALPSYRDNLKELYLFDRGNADAVNAWISSANSWAAGDDDKMIRLYSRDRYAYLSTLLKPSGSGALPSSATFVMDSTPIPNRTVGVLPIAAWQAVATPPVAQPPFVTQHTHPLVAGMWLTDALRRSAFPAVDPPEVTGLSPNSGDTTGGTSVVVSGSGFSAATAVRFGSVDALGFSIDDDGSVTASAPPGTGTVDVVVSTSVSDSGTSSSCVYVYV